MYVYAPALTLTGKELLVIVVYNIVCCVEFCVVYWFVLHLWYQGVNRARQGDENEEHNTKPNNPKTHIKIQPRKKSKWSLVL